MSKLIREKIVKTRKNYICHGCEHIIPAKSHALSRTYVYDDGIGSLYFCEMCIPVLSDDKFWDWNGRECCSGDIKEYLKEQDK